MLASIGLIFLTALLAAGICDKLRIPRLLGMLLAGILLGPCLLNLLDSSLLAVSADLREMALIIILIKAGLTLRLEDLKKVGRPALLLSFLPAALEIVGYLLLAPALFGINLLEAGIMGAVIGAVSPAVVVPKMVSLIESGYGTDKQIPQMILAGASLDDVFVIVLFSSLMGMAQGAGVSAANFLQIPISILTGVIAGALLGLALGGYFEWANAKKKHVRNSVKVVILLGLAFLLASAESGLSGIVPFSGLLAVMGMACALQQKNPGFVTKRLSEKFGKLWLAAELLLFVLVGAAVDIRYLLDAGLKAAALIFGALVFRAIGVLLSLTGTRLNRRERLFCVIAYLPKATVQAAIGSLPLAAGLACGPIVLSVAVMAILITAPLGAIGIERTQKKCCKNKKRPVPA